MKQEERQPPVSPRSAAGARPLRIFHVQPTGVAELSELPEAPPASGFLWLACARAAFQEQLPTLQAALQQLAGMQLVDLHVSDLLNAQLPSRYDYTSQYDLLVFRRLATTPHAAPPDEPSPADAAHPAKRSGPLVLRRIDTNPVGFALLDQVLLTVHPADCAVREAYAARLLAAAPADPREGRMPTPGARLPYGDEPDPISHLLAVAPHHKHYHSGISDILTLEETVKRNPQAVVQLCLGAFRAGMREFTANVAGNDLVRVTGYMVRLSDLEKFREAGSRTNTTWLGEEAARNTRILERQPRVISHEQQMRFSQ